MLGGSALVRDTFMDVTQALEFGIIDKIITKREVSAVEGRKVAGGLWK